MSSEVLTPREKKDLEKAKRDTIVLDAMADVVVASETINSALEKMAAAGSTLYRHKFKKLSNQYRKECVSILNNYYDFMAVGGVTDSFVNQMKAKAMLQNALGELDYLQVHKVGAFIAELLKPEDVQEEEAFTKPEQEEIVNEEDSNLLEDTFLATNSKIEDRLKEDDNPLGVTKEEEELNTHINEEKELTYEDILGEDDGTPREENELDRLVKGEAVPEPNIEEYSEPKPQEEIEVMVSQTEFSEIQFSHAKDGVHEEDLIKRTLNSLALRNGIDETLYSFNKAEKVEDDLILKFKLKA